MALAGYSPKVAPSSVEKSKALRDMIEHALARYHLTPDRICRKLSEKLDCVNPTTGLPDNGAQLRAVELTCKLGDYFPSQKIDISKRDEAIMVDIQTVRLAEQISGEKIIDAEIVGKEKDETTSARSADPL